MRKGEVRRRNPASEMVPVQAGEQVSELLNFLNNLSVWGLFIAVVLTLCIVLICEAIIPSIRIRWGESKRKKKE